MGYNATPKARLAIVLIVIVNLPPVNLPPFATTCRTFGEANTLRRSLHPRREPNSLCVCKGGA